MCHDILMELGGQGVEEDLPWFQGLKLIGWPGIKVNRFGVEMKGGWGE